jgi:hypothetical protein
MIKFFRQIRQSLIMENKTGKYFKYAIGEIILVVIGILIALQINNWNENRKEAIVEKKILKSLYNDIDSDIANMQSMMINDSILISLNKQLINILKDKNSTYHDSMDIMFGCINRYDVFFPQKSAYESLKSQGLDILKNDSLKLKVVNLYDYQYGLIGEVMDLKKQIYISTNPIFNKHLSYNNTSVQILNLDAKAKKPNNFNTLKTDKEFFNNLTHLYMEQKNFYNYSEIILEEIKSRKILISKEINFRQDD